MATSDVLLDTTGMFGGLRPTSQGKVRDTYEISGVGRLIVTTDRLSAFDVVMREGIPGKGKVLNMMTIMWLKKLQAAQWNHLMTASCNSYPEPFCNFSHVLDGRSMLVRSLNIYPIEGVVRGYLTGSGWKEYQKSGTVCGIRLPEGLNESDKLPESIFTPATKAESGHDINISHEQSITRLAKKMGISIEEARTVFESIMSGSISLYQEGAEYALSRGIIIADTKFEWGERLVLADEVLTPDSSRFWSLDDYKPGRSQKSFDKQPVRDWLESTDWDKTPPPPDLPAELVWETSRRYQEIYNRLAN